ncbi:uncharacterized protein LOC128722497 [Anopheles nili]|uniref:uncharacterized protein LOC128722497 n=1 Tax=Anopheles nili TaxID=185578 RepID=UPI00237AB9AB|nr:uncharacterized protein LOC128722497 [Anopheles nili]
MTTAIQYYDKSFKQLKVSSSLITAGLWKEKDPSFSRGRISTVSIALTFLLMHAWTGYKYRRQAMILIKSQSLTCTAFVLMIKYFWVIFKRDMVHKLTDEIKMEVYVKYGESSKEYPLVWKYGRILYHVGWIMACSYCLSLFIIMLNPVYVYLKDRSLVLIFFSEIPHVDWTQVGGYWITVLVQIVLYLTGVCGMILVDYLATYYTINGSLRMDVMRFHLDELQKLLVDISKRHSSATGLREEAHRLWRDCLTEHQQIVEFFGNFSDLWSMINLAQVGCSVIGICVNMLLLMVDNWYVANYILFVLVVDLTVHFVLGAIIEGKVDDLHNTLNQFAWYLLDDQGQHEYQLLLLRSQLESGLSIAGIAPVNYETYTKVLESHPLAMVV